MERDKREKKQRFDAILKQKAEQEEKKKKEEELLDKSDFMNHIQDSDADDEEKKLFLAEKRKEQ